jgi:hypothetical protein
LVYFIGSSVASARQPPVRLAAICHCPGPGIEAPREDPTGPTASASCQHCARCLHSGSTDVPTFSSSPRRSPCSHARRRPALAQDWPQPGKTIQLVVPAPGGSGTGDTIARVLAEELQSRLKTTFVVDNKAGANGNIGAGAAATSPGDG